MDLETCLIGTAVLLLVAGKILIAVQAFHVSPFWGVGVLAVPFLGAVFVLLHWEEAKVPFFIWLTGTATALSTLLIEDAPPALGFVVLVLLAGVTVWVMREERRRTGSVFHRPRSDSALDVDEQGRVLGLTGRDE